MQNCREKGDEYAESLLADAGVPAAVLVFCASAQATSLSRTDREFMNSVATMDMTGAHGGKWPKITPRAPK
jgi:hypothetical protein